MLLEKKLAQLEKKLKETEEALNISQRRSQIAVEFSDVTIFDYNIQTKRILAQPADFEIYGMPAVLENGVEDVIDSGIIADRSKEAIRELYHKIDAGAPNASAIVYANDLNGMERTLELQMVSIFDSNGESTYAVGVRKDITDFISSRKEVAYGKLLNSEFSFIYEANVTQNRILRYDSQWAKKLGLLENMKLTHVLQFVCDHYIITEDTDLFVEKQSIDFLFQAFQEGERIITFEYRKRRDEKGENGEQWFQGKLNLVQDEITKDLNMRVYILDISDRKQAEMVAVSQQKWYELALSKSAITYEINLTKDEMKWGHADLNEKLDSYSKEDYSERVLPVLLEYVHPADVKTVEGFLARKKLLEAYASGQSKFTCEYRKSNETGRYNWYRCSLQIFEEAGTKDILGYAYVEDINKEKERELLLSYKAQHDLMTGFYNKGVTEEKISEILFSEEGKGQNHVFFMIDLDYFKQVNDKFGHAFGDVVLSKTAQKIKKLFRGEDILGRIGGDEFVVFMKNAQDDKIAVMKAQELCDRIAEVYVQNGMDYKVTASVGIVLCEKGMRSYRELYIHADMALYAAKEQGRNGFFMYQDGMKMKGSAVKSIDPRQILEIQTFESNISQYVFRILYESQDKKSAIHSVLELMGKHYHVSRTYVFENSEDGAFAYNTFEWCNGGIASLCQETGFVDYEQLGNYADYFGREGVFYVADAEMVPSPLRDVLEMRKVRSMIQFSIIKNGRFAGFIGLDECTCLRVPESKELNDYRNFANILGVFITEMRAIEKMEVAKNMVLSVINGLDSYAYVCEPDTYKILFANVRTMKLAPKAKIGDCCYKAFWNFDAPCEQCSMRYLQDSGQDKCSRVTYKENLDCWLKISTSWVHWLGGTKACLIDAVDITEFKKKKE